MIDDKKTEIITELNKIHNDDINPFFEGNILRIELNKLGSAQKVHELVQQINNYSQTKYDYVILIKEKLKFPTGSIIRIKFSQCEFLEDVILHDNSKIEDTTFKNCIFHKGLDCYNVKFNKNVRFWNSKFKQSTRFENTTFEQLVDFYASEFFSDQQFLKTDFDDRAIFSEVIFHGAVQFKHNKIRSDTYISFESSTFMKSLDLSRSNFNTNLQFWGIKLENDSIKLISTESLYQNDENDHGSILVAIEKLRETYRIIKQSFKNNGNTIQAQYFHSLELAAYSFELENSNGKRAEKIMMKLNYWSNNYGQNWLRALGFTLIITLITYLLILSTAHDKLIFSLTLKSVGDTLNYFIQLINLTNWKYKPFSVELNSIGYVILFLGRIFISYGYYQLVQAFRKLSKN